MFALAKCRSPIVLVTTTGREMRRSLAQGHGRAERIVRPTTACVWVAHVQMATGRRDLPIAAAEEPRGVTRTSSDPFGRARKHQ